jgi:myo-inositol-hexaphosphate 3-phosphohydrolase|tara:strand:+ start:74 stop:286 length:213 start_codon:yes stop_codon:yes gene_type:complete
MAIKATISSTSDPIVTKIIKNQTTTNDIQGLTINYATVANGEVLSYSASANSFVPISSITTITAIDGGLE